MGHKGTGSRWTSGKRDCIVHPVATWTSPPMMRSRYPLAIYSSTGVSERWMHVGVSGFYTAVGESWKYDRWGSKNCDAWKVEKFVHYFVYTDKGTTDSFTDCVIPKHNQHMQFLLNCLTKRDVVLMRVMAVQSTPPVMSGLAMQGCVRGLNTGVDPSSSWKRSRKVVLRSCAISWSKFIREPLEWRSRRMRAVNSLFLLNICKKVFGAVIADFAGFHSY